MRGFGTYNLPAGTWSDDSALTFCLAEALTEKFDLDLIAGKFIKWLKKITGHRMESVFDVGITICIR